jgi:signal transduction histidine kinase
MTTRSVQKDGSDLYVDLSFALVKDDAGGVLGAVAVARDITGRYLAERESRRRLAELEADVKPLSSGRGCKERDLWPIDGSVADQ